MGDERPESPAELADFAWWRVSELGKRCPRCGAVSTPLEAVELDRNTVLWRGTTACAHLGQVVAIADFRRGAPPDGRCAGVEADGKRCQARAVAGSFWCGPCRTIHDPRGGGEP